MNIQKLKPHERQFFRDNEYAIGQLQSMAEEAFDIAKNINCKLYSYDHKYNFDIDDEASREHLKVLYPEVIDALKMVNHRLEIPGLCKYEDVVGCPVNIKINVFGMLKTGDLSIGSLRDDIADHSTYNPELNSRYFDLDSMICAGFDIWPMETGVGTGNGEHCKNGYNTKYVVLDVNALLVRLIQSGYTLGNEHDSKKAIIDAMVNKIFKLYIGHLGLAKMLYEYCGDNCYYDKQKPQIIKIDPRYTLDNVIKSLIIYKIWYNIINGLCEKEFEDTVDKLMDRWRVTATMFNTKQATNDIYRELYTKIVCGYCDRERFPDSYLETAKNMYNKVASWYIKDNHNKIRKVNRIVNGSAFVVGLESETADFILRSIGLDKKVYDSQYGNVKAVNCLLGMESVDISKFKSFNDYKKFTRAQVLAKLDSKSRMVFIKTENEIIRLRATAVNIKDEIGQQNCLRKASTIGKIIQMDIDKAIKDNNDAMVELLTLLDSERLDIMNMLADRNLVKERKTQLYGMVDKTSNWDY